MTEKVKRLRAPSKNSLRNMKQYKNMTDEEFDAMYSQIVYGVEKDEVILERSARLMDQFEEEYDLSDMLPNDRMLLRNLVSAVIQLEDYETVSNALAKEGISSANIVTLDKLSAICNRLRSDISKMQEDLKITRKNRKADKEQSVIVAIEDLKKKAKLFYEQKMHYLFCEKCGVLLATVWWLQPDYKTNKIRVECHKKDENGQICGWWKEFSAKDILESGGSNRVDLMPESMR